jgi:hypothetical protein
MIPYYRQSFILPFLFFFDQMKEIYRSNVTKFGEPASQIYTDMNKKKGTNSLRRKGG